MLRDRPNRAYPWKKVAEFYGRGMVRAKHSEEVTRSVMKTNARGRSEGKGERKAFEKMSKNRIVEVLYDDLCVRLHGDDTWTRLRRKLTFLKRGFSDGGMLDGRASVCCILKIIEKINSYFCSNTAASEVRTVPNKLEITGNCRWKKKCGNTIRWCQTIRFRFFRTLSRNKFACMQSQALNTTYGLQ